MADYLLVDLFCGAGGCSVGYARAGLRVVGVDWVWQARYPFALLVEDAVGFLRGLLVGQHFGGIGLGLEQVSAFHASPPCQAYSRSAMVWRARGIEYPDLIQETRFLLQRTGLPYIMENVPEAPLLNPLTLHAQDFGLKLARDRNFEVNFPVPEPIRQPKLPGSYPPVGHFSDRKAVSTEMGLPALNRAELAQAIPPAYTEYIGGFLLEYLLRL